MSDITLLDGATGTELDRMGVDIALPLWSARAVLHAPDQVEAVHRAYLEAGADALTTATFRTHRRSLGKEGLGDEALALTHRAVECARRARDAVRPDALILGSVAPLEECYAPELAPDEATCAREHRELVEHLVSGGVDLVVLETMTCLREARAAIGAARSAAPERWAVSFTMAAGDEPGLLLSGEPVRDLLSELEDAHAVGINCVSATAMQREVAMLRTLLPDHVPVMAYANVGEAADDGNWISTDAVEPARYAAYAKTWVDAGATWIGGCCGTRPATVAAIRTAIA